MSAHVDVEQTALAGVVYQHEGEFGAWVDCSEAVFNFWQRSGTLKLRKLYTSAQQPAPTIRDRELDRKHFTDASFNEWLDTGISDAGHTVWDAIGDTQAAWAGWDARPFAGDAVMLPECCGREECGGECGNDWLGLRMYRKPTEKPAPVVDDGNGVRACPVLIAARAQGVQS